MSLTDKLGKALANRIPEARIGDFPGTLTPQRSAGKDDCLSAKREFRLCSGARRSRVEKCPAREGITISIGLA